MDTLLYYICVPLGVLMKWCWQLVGNYGFAIILFTLATKIVLLPISVWTQKNSINMVKIQPAVNFLKAQYYGDMDTFAEEQSKLFKKEKYHPLITLIPLFLQVFLLLGVVQIIYHPLEYLFAMPGEQINALASYLGLNTAESSFQLQLIDAVKNGAVTVNSVVSGMDSTALGAILPTLQNFKTVLFGFNLSVIPMDNLFSIYILMPILAGLSSLALCITQNQSNVIQHEQGKLNQYGLTIFSVGLSLYLGIGVPAGIAVYWIASNLMSIAQMYILNAAINPKKYVNYAELEKSRKALADIENLDRDNKNNPLYKEYKKREKQDYKKFFSVVNKHVVIYSEKSGFYKYYEAIIDSILKKSNVAIHYITNDPDDAVFTLAETQPRIRPYYIGLKKMIPLMMKMEADIVVMTTPDLDKYYIKRSLMQKDIEYIYVPHDMYSVHMGFREGALDAFDTIFCTGPHVKKEVRATEEVYKLPAKKLVEFGYPFADKLIEAGEKEKLTHKTEGKKEILIAPSWQEDNLLDSCIDTLIGTLYGDDYHITVRPHPEYVKRYNARMQAIVEKYKDKVGENLTFELNFAKNKSVYSSDLLITDWSGIALEYCFATKRPALFVNTKLKCMNPNWEKIGITPTEISLRDELGVSIEKDKLADSCADTVRNLLANAATYEKTIADIREHHIYNLGHAGEVGADYILHTLVERRKTGKK